MSAWRQSLFAVVAVLPSLGASYRTANFAVEAPTPQIAKQVAQAAEKYRAAIARLWLGRALPDWEEPCVLNVDANYGEHRGGYSTFFFDRGRVSHQEMNIRGPLGDLLPKVLPHELTHAIFAHYFGCPVPRWADEGSAILSEDDAERGRRDAQMELILGRTAAYPLDELFDLNDYPGDLRVFYTQSYSVTRFLVGLRSRDAYLAFVAQGMRYGWDHAARALYGFESLEELDAAWRLNLRYQRLRREAMKMSAPILPVAQSLAGRLAATTWDAVRELEPALAIAVPTGTDVLAALNRLGAPPRRESAAVPVLSHAAALPVK
jgi:hypothetical protein